MSDSDAALEQEVLNMLQNNRYDPKILPRLEEYVNYQVEHQFVDAEANLAILKLYQFYPEKFNSSIVSKILIKALMSLPSTDFLCALYLIPEARQVDEPIPVISTLASLLETGRYTDFWSKSGSCADLLSSVPGSLEAIRDLMFNVVARTYHKVNFAVLKDTVNLDDKALREAISTRGWTVEGDTVTCPSNEDNQPQPGAADEQLSFRQVAAKMLF